MANRLVVFPLAKETEANAYAAWTDTRWPGYDPQDPTNTTFAYVRNDVFGQWVVPYLGPPFAWMYDENVGQVEVPEPVSGTPAEDGPTQRADGVLADEVTWPQQGGE